MQPKKRSKKAQAMTPRDYVRASMEKIFQLLEPKDGDPLPALQVVKVIKIPGTREPYIEVLHEFYPRDRKEAEQVLELYRENATRTALRNALAQVARDELDKGLVIVPDASGTYTITSTLEGPVVERKGVKLSYREAVKQRTDLVNAYIADRLEKSGIPLPEPVPQPYLFPRSIEP